MASNLRVDQITSSTTGSVSIGTATFTGGLSGDITGLNVTGVITATTLNQNVTGVVTATGGFVVGTGATISGSTNTITASTNGSERVRITSDGKFGMNQSAPYADLDITSSTETSTGTLAAHGIRLAAIGAVDEEVIPITAGFVSSQDRARAGIGFISKQADAINGYAGEIGFYTRYAADGSGLLRTDERLRITSTGNVKITNGNLVFSTSGTGIDFSATANSSGTMTSELLSDYEEGSWTPTMVYDVPGTSSFTYNGSQTVGKYIKIGRLVYVKYKVVLTAFSKGTASGDLYITGLPFTVEAGNVGESVSTVFMYDTPFDNTKHQQWIANQNSSDIRLKEVGNNAAHSIHTDPDSTAQYGGCLSYTTS